MSSPLLSLNFTNAYFSPVVNDNVSKFNVFVCVCDADVYDVAAVSTIYVVSTVAFIYALILLLLLIFVCVGKVYYLCFIICHLSESDVFTYFYVIWWMCLICVFLVSLCFWGIYFPMFVSLKYVTIKSSFVYFYAVDTFSSDICFIIIYFHHVFYFLECFWCYLWACFHCFCNVVFVYYYPGWMLTLCF